MRGTPNLELLTPPVHPGYAAMTYPAYRHLLRLEPGPRLVTEAAAPPVQPVAIGAVEGHRPVGLMLMELPLVPGEPPELLSIYVHPEARGRGLGVQLLEAAETVARNAGHERLRAVWTEGATGTGWLRTRLAERGWSEPTRRTLSVALTTAEAAALPWVGRLPVREGCEVVAWADLDPTEISALRASHERDGWIAEDLVPWRYVTGGYDEATSVALRGPDGIVGWVINHLLAPGRLRFTCSYIRKDLGRRARILPLYTESIRRAAAAGYTHCTFVAPVRHPTMVRFVERHVMPHGGTARWTVESTVRLERTGPAAGVPGARTVSGRRTP